MIKYIFLMFLSTGLAACNVTDKKPAVTSVPENNVSVKDTARATTTLEWIDPVTQDLGTVTQGQVVELSWKFKNTGTQPLTITDVHGGCGCTTSDTPKEPIEPGAIGIIKVKFNSEGKSGHQNKDVFVAANNTNRNNGDNNKLMFTADIKDK